MVPALQQLSQEWSDGQSLPIPVQVKRKLESKIQQDGRKGDLGLQGGKV